MTNLSKVYHNAWLSYLVPKADRISLILILLSDDQLFLLQPYVGSANLKYTDSTWTNIVGVFKYLCSKSDTYKTLMADKLSSRLKVEWLYLSYVWKFC